MEKTIEECRQRDKELLTRAMEGLLEVGTMLGSTIPDSGREIAWDNKRIVLWACENPGGMNFRFYIDGKLTSALALSVKSAYYLGVGIDKMLDENSATWVKEMSNQGKE
jgi:hypothetical protein